MNTDKTKQSDSAYMSAVSANTEFYNSESAKKYVHGAPHIKHAVLRKLYEELTIQACDYSKKNTNIFKILDLGAGEGTATLRFLELGGKVTAVDISKKQLDALKDKCVSYGNKLDVCCQDAEEFLSSNSDKCYDIVVVNSFLHHVPDYLGLIKKIIALLSPHGQFFSFQDPLRYDSVSRFTRMFSSAAYLPWRIFQGDVVNGIKRKMRRARGIYLDSCESDNAEYHVVRNGVDQNAIAELFKKEGFRCDVIPYFSTQSSIFQSIGSFLKLRNSFSIMARKVDSQ